MQRQKFLPPLFPLLLMLLAYACANRGQGPTGGKKDETPPRVLRSTPENNSVNNSKKKIQIVFDENINLEKTAENVIISPPQKRPPAIEGHGKVLDVTFEEDFEENTTYSINFGNAIVDLNEKNPLKDYVFSFSTGNEIDTLRISGYVINAEDLNPISGVLVGIYSEADDYSVFTRKPFLRIGRSNEQGHFSISNIKAGSYQIFALGDLNRDYFFQTGEGLAFTDSLLRPYSRIEEMRDTVWKDSITVDSVRSYMGTRFLPDDVLLRYFKEKKERQYFVKCERKEPHHFSLFFNADADSLPHIRPLNFDWQGKYLLEQTQGFDSLGFWLSDSLLWKQDTLRFEMSYLKSDSLWQLRPQTDTIQAIMRHTRATRRQQESRKSEALSISTNLSGSFEIYNPIRIQSKEPLLHVDLSKITLKQQIDTNFKALPLKWQRMDSAGMFFEIHYAWEPEKSYELNIDSAAFTSIYGKVNNKLGNNKFKIRSLDEYSAIQVLLEPFEAKAVIEVLDSKDMVVASRPAAQKGSLFEHLKPGDYYLRLFIDENGNGIWDSGDFRLRRQPETRYYYSKKLSLMANWTFEETWKLETKDLLKQKPAELRKDAAKKK